MSATISNGDAETSVLGRSRFFDALNRDIDQASRNEQMLGVVLVQIRNLDAINGECGYRAADIVLEKFVNGLSSTWCPRHTVGRFSNSKVAIVLPKLVGIGQVSLAANKIQQTSDDHLEVGGQTVRLRIAVGGAVSPDHGIDSDRLMSRAELALSHATQRADGIQVYSGDCNSESSRELTLEAELSTAVDNGELDLHYQPKIDLRSGTIVGVESLARWTSETQGPVRPDIFIEIAERSGLIFPLTLLTLNIALRQCAELRDSLGDLTVAVNLSAAILNDPEIDQLIQRAMTIWETRPESLVLEVTESAMMEEPLAALDTLSRLRATGVRISIDDFGTGYSSLAYLKNLPVNELKIDKSFVLNMIENEEDARIVKSVVDLAHNFDLTVVAEGVENAESLDLLTSMGCELAQGFYLGRPMPFEKLLEWNAESPWGK